MSDLDQGTEIENSGLGFRFTKEKGLTCHKCRKTAEAVLQGRMDGEMEGWRDREGLGGRDRVTVIAKRWW